jgi:hypothetical protein
VFYAAAQGFSTVGSGHFLSAHDCQAATAVMVKDLIVTRWQARMADDPSQDPVAVLADCTAYWNDPAQAATVCALTVHQASLFYASATSLDFTFNTDLAQAASRCADNGNQACAGITPPQGG